MRGVRHPYLWGRNHPAVVDAFIAVALAVFGLITEYANPDPDPNVAYQDPDVLSTVLTLGATLPLFCRRRQPEVVLVVVWPIALWHSTAPYPGGGPFFALLCAIYAAAAHARTRRAGVMAALLTVALIGVAFLVPELKTGLDDLLFVYTFIAIAWVSGDNMRIRRDYLAAVEDRAERLERERDVEAQRAVLEERARIARELHDVVAHSMSVMVVQAGAARRQMALDQEKAAEAIGHIEATGRSALEEMRRLVSVLRGSSDDTAPALLPQPQPGDLDRLIEGCREAGLDVSLMVDGEERPLPPGLGLVVYRVVQEALTNTIRHAGPAQATVTLRYRPDCLLVVVNDDGRGAAVSSGDTPGNGLAGMRERVTLYGGELISGPKPGGGFRVAATLPLTSEKVMA